MLSVDEPMQTSSTVVPASSGRIEISVLSSSDFSQLLRMSGVIPPGCRLLSVSYSYFDDTWNFTVEGDALPKVEPLCPIQRVCHRTEFLEAVSKLDKE